MNPAISSNITQSGQFVKSKLILILSYLSGKIVLILNVYYILEWWSFSNLKRQAQVGWILLLHDLKLQSQICSDVYSKMEIYLQ